MEWLHLKNWTANMIDLFVCVCIIPCVLGREYHFVNLYLNWTQAQQYCRVYYSDLATISSLDDINLLNRSDSYSGFAWIGLYDDPASWRNLGASDSNSWRWSVTGKTSSGVYESWVTKRPNGEDRCVSTQSSGLWYDHSCSHSHIFVCYTGSYGKTYYVNTAGLNWESAQSYCRLHYTDLALIETAAENDLVSSQLPANSLYAWIGLYRVPWRWSDNTVRYFTNWAGTYYYTLNCAVESADHQWYPKNCGDTYPFICQGGLKTKSTFFRMSFLSDLDMLDAVNYKMMLQQIEKQLINSGLTGVNIASKSPPIAATIPALHITPCT